MVRTTPARTEERRALKLLEGMLLGVAADGVINDCELLGLERFLGNHGHLLQLSPFGEVARELAAVIGTAGHIGAAGRQRFLAYCQDYEPCYTDANPDDDELRELHGFLTGLLADEVVNEAELAGLVRWLRVHQHLLDRFPCLHLAVRLQNLRYGRGDRALRERDLLSFCRALAERVIDAPQSPGERFEAERWARTAAPVCEPADALCSHAPHVSFPGRTFCFTGRAKSGQRSALETLVRERGGVPKSSVSALLDYLIIGGESSPAWMFAAYGRKIESAMNLRRQGTPICIVSEADFLAAVGVADHA